ncbi:MAG: MBL fold metallo-hydrolase [Ruminococcaceae bacterium]|nr:MBL fold metallo-hydrolase [Oscillospiraceae bacterium]
MDKKKLARVIATIIISFVMFSVFSLDILTLVLCNKYEKNYQLETENFTFENGDDRIHFLNTGNSDCILLESNGHFALIDSGEGDENPRKTTPYEGYKDEVISYLKKVAKNKDGVVYLDFVLGTHNHYDHIGSFYEIISDDEIKIGRAYFKKYNKEIATELEQDGWDNVATYDAVISAIKEKDIVLIEDLPDWEFNFGDFKLQFINTVTPEELNGNGENANSVGVIVTKGKKRAFLAADFTKSSGLEQLYGESIGDVDLLKIGHHGYYGSSSQKFLKQLKPEIAICTNFLGKIYPNVKWNLTMVAKVPIYATAHRNGIIATFTDSDEIILTEKIM